MNKPSDQTMIQTTDHPKNQSANQPTTLAKTLCGLYSLCPKVAAVQDVMRVIMVANIAFPATMLITILMPGDLRL